MIITEINILTELKSYNNVDMPSYITQLLLLVICIVHEILLHIHISPSSMESYITQYVCNIFIYCINWGDCNELSWEYLLICFHNIYINVSFLNFIAIHCTWSNSGELRTVSPTHCHFFMWRCLWCRLCLVCQDEQRWHVIHVTSKLELHLSNK